MMPQESYQQFPPPLSSPLLPRQLIDLFIRPRKWFSEQVGALGKAPYLIFVTWCYGISSAISRIDKEIIRAELGRPRPSWEQLGPMITESWSGFWLGVFIFGAGGHKRSSMHKLGIVYLMAGLLILLNQLPGWGMTVEEAYQAIPHRRTAFDVNTSKINHSEKEFLTRWFDLVDQAILERVEHLNRLRSGGDAGQPNFSRYKTVLAEMGHLEVPARLDQVHGLVMKAVEEQRKFLLNWYRNKWDSSLSIAQEPLIQSSSHKLRSAYSELMSLYSGESEANRQAFFDYLCALDFI